MSLEQFEERVNKRIHDLSSSMVKDLADAKRQKVDLENEHEEVVKKFKLEICEEVQAREVLTKHWTEEVEKQTEIADAKAKEIADAKATVILLRENITDLENRIRAIDALEASALASAVSFAWTLLHEALNNSQHQDVGTCMSSEDAKQMVMSVAPEGHRMHKSTVFHIAAFRSPYIGKGTTTN